MWPTAFAMCHVIRRGPLALQLFRRNRGTSNPVAAQGGHAVHHAVGERAQTHMWALADGAALCPLRRSPCCAS